MTHQAKAREGSFRANEQAAERKESRDPARAAQKAGAAPAPGDDALLWYMAKTFADLAWDPHRVSLDGRGHKYLAMVLAEPVDRVGLRDLTCTDGDGKTVPVVDLGIRLVEYFWEHAPWDADGDVLRQFADPVNMEAYLDALRQRWENRRVHLALQARIKAGTGYAPFRRSRKKPVGYKSKEGK